VKLNKILIVMVPVFQLIVPAKNDETARKSADDYPKSPNVFPAFFIS